MMEYFLIGILIGLLILWIINIKAKLDETEKELKRIITVLGNKEQWELNKFQIETLRQFQSRELDFLTYKDLELYMLRFKKSDEDKK